MVCSLGYWRCRRNFKIWTTPLTISVTPSTATRMHNDGHVTKVESSLTQVQTDVTKGNAEVAELKTDVAAIKTEVAKGNAEVAAVKTEVAKGNGEVAQVKVEVAQEKTAVNTQTNRSMLVPGWKFIGRGEYGSSDDSIYSSDISFMECELICGKKSAGDPHWNGMVWHPYIRCQCVKNDVGHFTRQPFKLHFRTV